MKKFAVILCGCGSLDGSEIHESVMTLLAVDKSGSSYTVFAPDDNQYQVVNHITKQPMQETRNMMVEASRISRGEIYPISEYDPQNFDALILPGGNGAAKNLFTYGLDGVQMSVRKDVERVILDTFHAKKPIGALCIAPVLLAKVLNNITLTVGSDESTIQDVVSFGATNQVTSQSEVCKDVPNLIFSTPCYMLPATIKDIAASADNLIQVIVKHIS
jgi:enhancing lycopene biosynthesis protein 2